MTDPRDQVTDIAVTVTAAAPDADGHWAVVDTHGRARRLATAAVDPRLVTLHPGQRLRVTLGADGALRNARL